MPGIRRRYDEMAALGRPAFDIVIKRQPALHIALFYISRYCVVPRARRELQQKSLPNRADDSLTQTRRQLLHCELVAKHSNPTCRQADSNVREWLEDALEQRRMLKKWVKCGSSALVDPWLLRLGFGYPHVSRVQHAVIVQVQNWRQCCHLRAVEPAGARCCQHALEDLVLVPRLSQHLSCNIAARQHLLQVVARVMSAPFERPI